MSSPLFAFKSRWRWLTLAAITIPFAYHKYQPSVPELPAISPAWLALVLVLLVVAGVFLLRLAKLEAQLEPRLAVAEPGLEYAVLGSMHNLGLAPISANRPLPGGLKRTFGMGSETQLSSDPTCDIVVTGTVRVSWSGKWDQMKVQNVTGRVPAVRPEVAPAA
jgi:hypothetical protein